MPISAYQVIGQHRQLEMIPVHIKAPRRMRRQPGIVVRLFDQILRTAALAVKPDHEGYGLAQGGHEDSILVLAGFEQLVLLAFLPAPLLRRLSHSAGPRTDMPSSTRLADSEIHTPTRH